MLIKFSCKNHCLDFEKTSEELQTEKVITNCPYCGEKLSVTNLDQVVAEDIRRQVEAYVTESYKINGLEGTLEIIERLQNKTVQQYYKNELKKRRLIR